MEIVNNRHQMEARKEAGDMLEILARTFMTATRTELSGNRGFRPDPQGRAPVVRARWAGPGR
jgi:hypothetical protein